MTPRKKKADLEELADDLSQVDPENGGSPGKGPTENVAPEGTEGVAIELLSLEEARDRGIQLEGVEETLEAARARLLERSRDQGFTGAAHKPSGAPLAVVVSAELMSVTAYIPV